MGALSALEFSLGLTSREYQHPEGTLCPAPVGRMPPRSEIVRTRRASSSRGGAPKSRHGPDHFQTGTDPDRLTGRFRNQPPL
jgi:hypothetical protein